MAVQSPAPRRRVSAPQRREQMVAMAIAMARESGVGALTLARVAEAGGVSKPLAYRHFGTMAGLLRAVYDKIGTEYEDAILGKISLQAERGVAPVSMLRELCEAYVACSIDSGALLDEIGAALLAVEDGAQSCRVASANHYTDVVARLCGIDRSQAYGLTVAFVGAADRICEAVIAGYLDRQEGVTTLVTLFTPHLVSGPGDLAGDARAVVSP